MAKPIAITAHFDDAEIFLGVMADQCERVYIAASPARIDHLRIMEEERLPRGIPWGMISEYWWQEGYLRPEWRESRYTAGDIKERIRWVMNDQRTHYGTQEVLTHNPHGEYGHIHHRRVSKAVCELAVEFDMTVWAPAHVVSIEPGNMSWTVDDCGMEVRVKAYPRQIYEYRRYLYQKLEPEMPSKLWTWTDELPPPETQLWIKLVDEGADMRNARCRQLEEVIPTYGL